MKKIAFIGLGNMGSSIAQSIRDKYEIRAFDLDSAKVKALSIEPSLSISDAIEDADIILIAIKPQYITKEFLLSIKREGKSYITIAAGIPLECYERNLGAKNIARFMPNLAAKEKKAVTAICFSPSADESFKKEAEEIASSFGSAIKLNESQFSAFTGSSGSFIAYVLEFINSSSMAAVNEGLSYADAERIVIDTITSALSLIKDGKSAASIIPLICSANGTTIRGMEKLEECGFSNALYKAIKAAKDRSDEIEIESKERL